MTTPRACPYTQIPLKKGVAIGPLSTNGGQWTLSEQQAVLDDLEPAFWYNYRLTAEGVTTPNFIPMFTNRTQINDPEISAAATVAAANLNIMLEYNEPDNTAITALECATDHDAIRGNADVIANGTTLGSIVTASDGSVGGSYFQDYLAAITTALPEYYVIHSYGHSFTVVGTSISQILSRVTSYQTAFPGKDLWLTEFDLNDGLGGTPTDAQVKLLMNSVCQWLEATASVTNYAWWAALMTTAFETSFPNSHLYNHDGSIAAIGTEYRDQCGKHPTIIL